MREKGDESESHVKRSCFGDLALNISSAALPNRGEAERKAFLPHGKRAGRGVQSFAAALAVKCHDRLLHRIVELNPV